MHPLASVSMDFLGKHGFAWWAVVMGVLGAALLVYSFLQMRPAAATSLTPTTTPRPKIPWISISLGGGAIFYALCAGFLAPMRNPWLAIVLTSLLAAGAIWLFYQRVYQFLGRGRMFTLFTLRVTGIVFLVLLLFKPVIAWINIPHHVGTLGIVLDASGSMSVSDQPNEPSRYLQSVLGAQILERQLKHHFKLLYFAYDGVHNAPLTAARDLSAIAPDGKETDLPTAIKLAYNAGCKQIVLFSDGIQNGPTKISSLAQLDVPVYTVRVGSTSTQAKAVPEIEIVRINGPQSAPVGSQVTLTALIRSTALNDRTVRVSLMHGKKELASHRLVLESGPIPQQVKFKFTPEKVGRMVLLASIPVDPQERSTAGNKQQFPMLITNPRIAVLYLEGRVRPEVGPLESTLAMDPNISLVSLIETRPGYFMVRGAQNGVTAIPTTLAQWEKFKVIILGDVKSNFLSPAQQDQLRQAISHGIGFMMIGGQQNFAAGSWGDTDLAAAFPVSLEPTSPAQLNTPFVPELTAFGRRNSIFQGIAQWFISPTGQAGAAELPNLAGCVALAGPKPGASVLLVDPRANVHGKPAIVLATEHYGKGRTAAFAGDTTYRWNLLLGTMGARSPYHRFWGQLVRWLAGESKVKTAHGPSVTAMIRRERYENGQPVRLKMAVTDMHGQSTAYAHGFVSVTYPDGKVRRLRMHASHRAPGGYQRNIVPSLPGKYHAVFTAFKGGKKLGTDTSDFYVIAPIGEMDKLAAEPRILRQIASQTGGAFSELGGISSLGRRILAAQPANNRVQRSGFPLYNNTLFFLLFVAGITVEWILRRKWQLQ